MWTQIRLLLQSDLGPHCLPVCKNRFEKFARIFSRRYKQTTFSYAGFLGALRVNVDVTSWHCIGLIRRYMNVIQPPGLDILVNTTMKLEAQKSDINLEN